VPASWHVLGWREAVNPGSFAGQIAAKMLVRALACGGDSPVVPARRGGQPL